MPTTEAVKCWQTMLFAHPFIDAKDGPRGHVAINVAATIQRVKSHTETPCMGAGAPSLRNRSFPFPSKTAQVLCLLPNEIFVWGTTKNVLKLQVGPQWATDGIPEWVFIPEWGPRGWGWWCLGGPLIHSVTPQRRLFSGPKPTHPRFWPTQRPLPQTQSWSKNPGGGGCTPQAMVWPRLWATGN